jgi:hypothetical protein
MLLLLRLELMRLLLKLPSLLLLRLKLLLLLVPGVYPPTAIAAWKGIAVAFSLLAAAVAWVVGKA